MYGPLKDLTLELFASQRVEQHALLLLLEGDRLTLDEARAIGLDIFHVVDAFPRFLAAVLTHITDYRERMNLVENLYAEHGRMREEHVHVVTYRSFLHALGLSDAQIDVSEPGLEIVARVSPIVARFGKRRLGVGASMGSHFSVHEAIDLSHADEIYALAARACARGREREVRRGIALGFYYQTRLYTDLVESRVARERLVEIDAHNRPAYLDLVER